MWYAKISKIIDGRRRPEGTDDDILLNRPHEAIAAVEFWCVPCFKNGKIESTTHNTYSDVRSVITSPREPISTELIADNLLVYKRRKQSHVLERCHESQTEKKKFLSGRKLQNYLDCLILNDFSCFDWLRGRDA